MKEKEYVLYFFKQAFSLTDGSILVSGCGDIFYDTTLNHLECLYERWEIFGLTVMEDKKVVNVSTGEILSDGGWL